jgi:hypothetical protein
VLEIIGEIITVIIRGATTKCQTVRDEWGTLPKERDKELAVSASKGVESYSWSNSQCGLNPLRCAYGKHSALGRQGFKECV